MNSKFGTIWLIIGLVISRSGFAQAQQSEQLLFTPPSNFELGANLSHDPNKFMEYVPSGQTVEDWTDMITVQIYRPGKIEPADFLQRIGKGIIGKCPGTVSDHNIHTGTTNGYTVSMLDLKCPSNPQTNKPETIIFRVIKGDDALYSVQYAWRLVPTAEQIEGAAKILGKSSLCNSSSTLHPCGH